MSLTYNSLIVANYVWWCPEDTTYTTATATGSETPTATVANSYYCANKIVAADTAMGYGKPTATNHLVTVSSDSTPSYTYQSKLAWTEWGSVIKVSPDISAETVKNRIVNGFVLQTLDEVPTSLETKLSFTLEQVPDSVLEAMFLASLNATTNQMTIGSKPMQRGWLKWQWVTPDGKIVAVQDVFGYIKVSGFDVGSEDFIKPTVEFTQTASQSGMEYFKFIRDGITSDTDHVIPISSLA